MPEESSAADKMAKSTRAFPKLTEDQIAVLKSRMVRRTYPDGAALMIAGSPDFCFHLIESGELDVVAMEDCEERVVSTHGPGDFTGDVEDLSGRGASVTLRAKGPTTVWEMSLDDLRATINDRIDLADTIMTTFISRWQSLRDARLASVYVIGRQHESATFMVVD
ncbi:cyclic nucleotide-binding domain-containing protein, partial [bacterium]